jgi:hypothetical protein
MENPDFLSIEDIQVLNIDSQPLKHKPKLDLEKINQTLPDDILRTIYDNYLSPQLVYDKLQLILKSKESRNLNHFPLSEYLEKVIFKEPLVIEKLKMEDPLFLLIYSKEFVENSRTFKKFSNKYDSFALSWLMHLYH